MFCIGGHLGQERGRHMAEAVAGHIQYLQPLSSQLTENSDLKLVHSLSLVTRVQDPYPPSRTECSSTLSFLDPETKLS